MSLSIHKIISILGFVSLFHSAFSAAQHRSYLRLTSAEFSSLPADIVLQAVLSLLAVMSGVLRASGDLREIRATADHFHKTWDSQINLPSFYHYNHRGQGYNKPKVSFLDNKEPN